MRCLFESCACCFAGKGTFYSDIEVKVLVGSNLAPPLFLNNFVDPDERVSVQNDVHDLRAVLPYYRRTEDSEFNYDDYSYTIVVYIDDLLVGTMRITIKSDLPDNDIGLEMEVGEGAFHETVQNVRQHFSVTGAYAEISKLVVLETRIKSNIMAEMTGLALKIALNKNTELLFCERFLRQESDFEKSSYARVGFKNCSDLRSRRLPASTESALFVSEYLYLGREGEAQHQYARGYFLETFPGRIENIYEIYKFAKKLKYLVKTKERDSEVLYTSYYDDLYPEFGSVPSGSTLSPA